jgi:hypothetical protein
MNDPQVTSASPSPAQSSHLLAGAVAKVIVLLALCGWAFWPVVCGIVRRAVRHSDWAHTLVLPIVLLALLVCRRRRLAACITRGSVWGLWAIVTGLMFYALCSRWPLNFGYAGDVAIVPVLGGIVLATCGWRVLKHCLPLLLVVLLSIPLGQRMYAGLIIRPETATLSAARLTLSALPGVDVRLEGQDLIYDRGERSGAIALGQPNRGASLLFVYAVVGAFVVFSRFRPAWHLIVLGVIAGPIVLLCNWLRVFVWGVVSIYAGSDAISALPRTVAVTSSLAAVYAAFGLACGLLSALFSSAGRTQAQTDQPSVQPDA